MAKGKGRGGNVGRFPALSKTPRTVTNLPALQSRKSSGKVLATPRVNSGVKK